LKGKLSICRRKRYENNSENLLILPGFYFGEDKNINRAARNVSAISIGKTELFFLDEVAFEISFFVI